MGTEDGQSIDELLAEASRQTDETLASLQEQPVESIDLEGVLDTLPGKVLDWFRDVKDQLNENSRAVLEAWESDREERWRVMYESAYAPITDAVSAYRDALYSVTEDPQIAKHREYLAEEAEYRRRQWEMLERSERAFQASLPPNWSDPDVEFPSLEELEKLQLKEGLPLAWVPPNAILTELLEAPTAAARRRILTDSADALIEACLKELKRLKNPDTARWRGVVKEVALALQDGHWRAGQALAAIALDAAVAKYVRYSYPEATKQTVREKGGVKVALPPGSSKRSLPSWRDIDYPRALLVLHSLYGSFAEYDGNGNEKVPTQFTRHGTVHSIDRRQYSKGNALIALLQNVSFLCLMEEFYETDLAKEEGPNSPKSAGAEESN